jgi:N-acyl-L-homoserine lactone synthetase
MSNAFQETLCAVQDELSLEIARSPRQIREAKELRYKVYCEERGYEPGENGIEQDQYDPNAHHVLVRSRDGGKVFGTVRLVLSKRTEDGVGFPMESVCENYVLAPLPASATAEISRFALTRDRTGLSPAAAAVMRLFLIEGCFKVSGELGLTHWCAIMEKTLLRLLRVTSIHFVPVGPAIEYHGLRQPAVLSVGSTLERMRRESHHLWSFMTENGALWSEEAVLRNGTQHAVAAA